MDVQPGDFLTWIAPDFTIGSEVVRQNSVYIVDRLSHSKFGGFNNFYLVGIKIGPFSWDSTQFSFLYRPVTTTVSTQGAGVQPSAGMHQPVDAVPKTEPSEKFDWLGSIKEAAGRLFG